MKRYPGFFPRKDTDKLSWHIAYRTNIGKRGAELGLSQELIDKQQEASTRIIDSIIDAKKRKNEAAAAVSHKNQMIDEGERIIGNLAVFLKLKSQEEDIAPICALLGILGNAQELDRQTIKPSLKATSYSHIEICIDFVKNYAPAIAIYTKLEGDYEWELLDHAVESPYYDRRPVSVEFVPEVREYRAICTRNTKPMGQFSDIVSAVKR